MFRYYCVSVIFVLDNNEPIRFRLCTPRGYGTCAILITDSDAFVNAAVIVSLSLRHNVEASFKHGRY